MGFYYVGTKDTLGQKLSTLDANARSDSHLGSRQMPRDPGTVSGMPYVHVLGQ